MRKWVDGAIGLLTLLYPVAVYFGIQFLQPWKIAIIFSILLLLRLFTTQASTNWNRLLLLSGIAYCGLAAWNNNLISLRFYPVLVNLVLFTVFTASLFFPPSVIERLARIQHPDLPVQGVIYTRKVTQVWSAFFLLNGLVALLTALWSSMAWWSLYNGFIAYVLMAMLMGIEYRVRIRTQAHVR